MGANVWNWRVVINHDVDVVPGSEYLFSMPIRSIRALAVVAAVSFAPGMQPSFAQNSPPVSPSKAARPALAPPKTHVERLQRFAFDDPYRWMEVEASEEVRIWTEAQRAYADAVLREPSEQARLLTALIEEFASVPTLEEVIPIPGGVIFDRWLPAGQVYRLSTAAGPEQALFDPGVLTTAGRSARVRAVIPSWDGRYAVLTATSSGDASVQASVIEIGSGRLLPDIIPDLLTTTSGARYRVAWLPDGSGFIYPRLAPGALVGPAVERLSRGRQYFHRLGTPQSADVPVFGFGVDGDNPFAPDDLPASIVTAPGSDWLVATVSRVKENVSELWAARLDDLGGGRPQWLRIAGDGFRQVRLRGNKVYAITDEDADRGRIVSLDLSDGGAAWRTVIPERAGVLRSLVLCRDAIYFTEYLAGTVKLARARYTGAEVKTLGVPIAGDLRFAPQDPTRDTPWIKAQTWTDPGNWFRIPPRAADAVASGIDPGGNPTDQGVFVIRHIMITADDGVSISVSLVHLSGLRLDGTTPLLLEAYGGYGDVQAPAYNPSLSTWVRQGAVYAYAHVRGGGELGGSWRRAATRERKTRSSLDVVSVANGLIALGYTSQGRIAILGTSSGAQMPGLAITINPSLFGAAVFDVGQPDEIRGAQLDPTAARNLAEMGDIDTNEGVRLLADVSPYHRVPVSARFPGIIVRSGADDYNFGSSSTDAKYVARLQAANGGDRPIIWMNGSGGHDSVFGNDPTTAAQAIAFMLWQAGHPAFQPVP